MLAVCNRMGGYPIIGLMRLFYDCSLALGNILHLPRDVLAFLPISLVWVIVTLLLFIFGARNIPYYGNSQGRYKVSGESGGRKRKQNRREEKEKGRRKKWEARNSLLSEQF